MTSDLPQSLKLIGGPFNGQRREFWPDKDTVECWKVGGERNDIMFPGRWTHTYKRTEQGMGVAVYVAATRQFDTAERKA